MYLEVYVFNTPSLSLHQIDNEELLPAFPSSDILIKLIGEKVKHVLWENSEVGRVKEEVFEGEVIFGLPSDSKTIYFRIRGGTDPIGLVLELCEANGWSGYTPENEIMLNRDMNSVKYWQDYKKYKGIIDDVFYND